MVAKIEHRLGVQAPASKVWDLVSNLDTWSSWNPLYPQASGTLRIGNKLTMTLVLPGQASRVIHPTVVDWVPLEQLHWKVSIMGGLVSSLRYIEIESMHEGGCTVSNGEIFMGLLGPSVAGRFKREIREGFAAMGEALRDHAEAAWQAEQQAPTSSA